MGNFGGRGGGGGFNSRGGSRGGGGFNRGSRGGFDGKPMEKHKAKCSKFGKDCEVPFKPTPGRDVFCKECYAKVNPRF